jgi:glyoxylase-like metal-dependent hydrolase (beta-lactamase superfamily II)
VIGRRDWEFWTDDTELSRLVPIFGAWSRRNLDPFADQVELVDDDLGVAPGVHILAAPGHTPGHIAVALRSEGAELLYVSDAALHPIHLEHPTWRPVWDQDPDAALTSRRRLFDQAAIDGALVLAFHFPPFPSLGHVLKRGKAWHWEGL